MLTKKKKIFMLAGMILLLAVTAYLNFALAAKADNNDDLITAGNFFTQYRTERQTTRNQEISYLDSVINSTGAEYEEARATAMNQKLKIISVMEQELVIENLLKSKGYEDVVVTIGITSDTVNVIVKSAELKREDTAVIYTTISEHTTVSADNVRIIPVT